MKSILTLMGLIAALALAVPANSMAETKKKTTDAPKTDAPKSDAKKDDKKAEKKDDDKKKDTYPLYGEVVSATDTVLTIKGGKDKPDHTYDITKDTKIHSGDKPATVKDIKKGAWVGGLLKKSADGKGNASLVSLNLDVKQKQDKEEKKATAEPKKTDDKPKTDAKTDTKKKKS